jgi:undecaprenyl-diphosphatase
MQILAVLFFFWKKFFDINLLTKLFIAFLPTGILGLLVFKHIKTLLSSEVLVACTLVLGGIILILVEKNYKKVLQTKNTETEISFSKSFLLGLAQSVAMIPGVSRSGTTIVAGLLMNIERKILVEFTFLLAVPTMSAATLYSLYKHKEILTTDYLSILVLGFISSFLVAMVVIKFFLEYIKKYDKFQMERSRIFLYIPGKI